MREHGNTRIDHRDKVARIDFDLRDLYLSPEQRERFVFLMGPRYKEGHQQKLVCRQFLTFQENYVRALEQLREIYWEAKRAPDRIATLTRNPYRRPKILKKIYGKTKEERKANKIKIREELDQHYQRVEEEIVEAEIKVKDKQKHIDKRRKEIAARRAHLGFTDTELSDHEIARLDYAVKNGHQTDLPVRKMEKMPKEL